MAAQAELALRREVLRGAKQRGLTLRPGALRVAVGFMVEQTEIGWDANDTLAYLLEKAEQKAGVAVLDEATVQGAAVAVTEERSGEGSSSGVFESIDVFKVQRHLYNSLSSQFVANLGERKMDSKTAMLRDRFELLQQRLLRDPKFELDTSVHRSSTSEIPAISITPIGALLGSEGPKCVFGMLSKNERMQVDAQGVHAPVYHLEDLDGRVALELTEDTQCGDGLITEGCCVFAEGEYIDGVYRVTALAHPPPEPRAATLEFLGNTNLFGGSDPRAVEMDDEMDNELSRLVITLSDVHLDNPTVMGKLRVLLGGYSMMEPPPAAFVLMGNFFAQPTGSSGGLDRQAASQYFADLGALINEFPVLAQESQFVLVPGPTDPGPAPGLIPRPPLPQCFTKGLRELLPTVHLGSNPCRVHSGGHHMVFFREDIMHKMRRAQVLSAEVDEEAGVCHHHHLAHTVIAQSSLCPLLPSVRPVHWSADHGLNLYPQPHLVVLADRAARYAVPRDLEAGVQREAAVYNPGSFSTDFGFAAYTPATAEIEACQLPP